MNFYDMNYAPKTATVKAMTQDCLNQAISPATERMPEIQREINQLDKQLERLNAALGKLVANVAPVTRDTPEPPSENKKSELDESCNTPLGQRLKEFNQRLQMSITGIYNLADHIEL